MIKISVILAVYNTEKYLRKCLDSLINQTLQDIEIICVNDGSTDNSLKILNEYQKLDSRIKVVNKENGGLSSARNEGMKYAKGEYIMHFDSDDYYELNMLEYMYNQTKENNCDVFICGYYTEYVNEGYVVNNSGYDIVVKTDNELRELIYFLNISGMFNLVWNKIYKTSYVKNNQFKFPDFATTGQDLFFNVDIFKNTKKIGMTKKQFCHYMKYDTETLVSKFHSNLYYIALKRYESIKELFDCYKMDSIKEREWLVEYYFHNIQNCLINLFRKDCIFNKNQKLDYIKQFIIENNFLTDNLKYFKCKNLYDKIFLRSIKFQNVIIIYYFYYLLFLVRNKFSGIYKIIRKNFLVKK